MTSGDPEIIRNMIRNNTAVMSGGGIQVFNERADIASNEILENNAPQGGGIYGRAFGWEAMAEVSVGCTVTQVMTFIC